VSGIAAIRCTSCREVVLIGDRGRLRVVVPAAIIGVNARGEPDVRCGCGAVSTWKREPQKVGEQ
jgi:hypothetical protein